MHTKAVKRRLLICSNLHCRIACTE